MKSDEPVPVVTASQSARSARSRRSIDFDKSKDEVEEEEKKPFWILDFGQDSAIINECIVEIMSQIHSGRAKRQSFIPSEKLLVSPFTRVSLIINEKAMKNVAKYKRFSFRVF
jgi:hypothetical protein